MLNVEGSRKSIEDLHLGDSGVKIDVGYYVHFHIRVRLQTLKLDGKHMQECPWHGL